MHLLTYVPSFGDRSKGKNELVDPKFARHPSVAYFLVQLLKWISGFVFPWYNSVSSIGLSSALGMPIIWNFGGGRKCYCNVSSMLSQLLSSSLCVVHHLVGVPHNIVSNVGINCCCGTSCSILSVKSCTLLISSYIGEVCSSTNPIDYFD